jgi:hypothetical protein
MRAEHCRRLKRRTGMNRNLVYVAVVLALLHTLSSHTS